MATKTPTNPLSDYVDPFLGNGTTDLPPAEGIAAAWFWPKAQTGNTHPGACRPFGMVSAGAYSGAYPTGYGLNRESSEGLPRRMFDEFTATGFAHFHQSGTGNIKVFYNYLRAVPFSGAFAGVDARHVLSDEEARPGYYAATLGETGIKAELTVDARAACHRYTFPGGPAGIALDLRNGGVDCANLQLRPTEAEVRLLPNGEAAGFVRMCGVYVYFHAQCDGAEALTTGLWTDVAELSGQTSMGLPEAVDGELPPFGVLFSCPDASPGKPLTLRIGFSLRSSQKAEANLRSSQGRGFDEVAAESAGMWEEALSRIQVRGGTDRQRRIFYSALYHSLIKPSDFTDENPFWDEDGPLFMDVATMWDIAKTQLPLVLTAYPERGVPMVNALLAMGRHFGQLPNAVVMSSLEKEFSAVEMFDSKQARALAHVTIADAWHRQLPGIDWEQALDVMCEDLFAERNAEFFENGVVHPLAHCLDLAYGCFCTAEIAAALGRDELAERLRAAAGNWRNAYDSVTCRLSEDSWYYEGGLWNYSFRLLHDMAGRVGIYPDEEAFVRDLDAFFGYDCSPLTQPGCGASHEEMAAGIALGRFEGLNNEPDMECPYAYLYAGRHDRTAEVVRAVMAYQFGLGPGGLAGNDDSGGLSAWYVWNAIGLFPAVGQNVVYIGSPIFGGATIAVGDATLEVEATDVSAENLYVQSASLNGERIDRAWISVDELRAGGKLALEMGPEPSDWATETRPPSPQILTAQ